MKVSMWSFYLVKYGEGISRYVEELQHYLLSENITCSFTAPKFGNYTRLIYPAAAVALLKHFLETRDNYEIYHMHFPIPILTVLFSKTLRSSKECIFQIWNPPLGDYQIPDKAQRLINSKELARLVLKNFDSPVVVSTRYMKQVLEAAGAECLHYIPAGVDKTKFPFSSRVVEHDTDDPVLLYCGHLTKWKGVENLVEAMPLIVKERPYTQLKIAWTGHGRSYNRILQQIKRLELSGHVIVENKLCRNTNHLFETADIGVLPLLSPVATASPPRTLLEMMSKGLPVVATRVGGVSEIVRDKETGMLVDPSPKGLAEGILTLLSDSSLRQKMGSAAREYVETNHDWQDVGPHYLKLYEEYA